MAQRLGAVHAVSGLRRGDPQGALLDECHRVPQRSVPQSRVGAGTLSHRTGRDEVPLPGHQGTGPQGHRADTMDHTLEAGVKRLRSHIRGPDARGRGQLNINMKIAVYTGFRTDPLAAFGGHGLADWSLWVDEAMGWAG